MSHTRRSATTASTLAAAMIAALVALLALGRPAYAEDAVRVEIRGLPSNMTAGRDAERFQANFTNTTETPRSGVRAVIAVRLEGAPPDAIRVERAEGGGDLPREVSGDGSVMFSDPDPFDLPRDGGRTSRGFRLSFGDGAPPGEASITVAAYVNGELLGSGHRSVQVRHDGGGPQPPSTPPNTDPGFVPPPAAGPSYSIAPLPVAQARRDRDASAPKSLYVLGSLLVALGVGSLVLIFRSPRRRTARVGGPARTLAAPWHPRGESAPHPRLRPIEPAGPARSWPGHDPGPATGTTRRIHDPGPTRPIRDPGPGDALPPWLRP